jgi:predicted porin
VKTKRTPLFAAAALACAFLAPCAFAQSSVQIYGIMDAGVMASDTGAAGPSKKTELATGNGAGTRLGFRGTEDLGAGLKALFELEMGIANDTGELIGFGEPGGVFFGRKSFVGLAGGFGELHLGRDYTPAWQTIFRTDRFRFGLPGTTSTASGVVFTRANNGIFYASPVISGFRARLAYSFGAESVAVHDRGRLAGGTLEYRNGPLFVSAAMQRRGDLEPGSTTETASMTENGIGADYELGRYGFSAGYGHANPVTATAGAVDESRAVWLGASMKVGTAGKLQAQVTRTRLEVVGRSSGRALTAGVAYIHSLSKRTSLYAGFGTVRNDENARMPLNTGTVRVGGTEFGADPRAVLVGMRHDF